MNTHEQNLPVSSSDLSLGGSSLFPKLDEGTRVTILGAILDFVIGIAKVIVGLLGHSHAMVADGVHSLSDVATDIVVIIGHRLSKRPACSRYPYGLKRLETIGVLMIGMLLLLFALGLLVDNVRGLGFGSVDMAPSPLNIAVIVVCIALKESYYWVSLSVGRRLNSDLLIANAQHSRTDVFSSLVVFAGLVGTQFGFLWLDQALAVAVSLIVAKIAVDFIRKSTLELLDANFSQSEEKEVSIALLQVPGVCAYRNLHARSIAGDLVVECELVITDNITIAQWHDLHIETEQALKSTNARISKFIPIPIPQSKA